MIVQKNSDKVIQNTAQSTFSPNNNNKNESFYYNMITFGIDELSPPDYLQNKNNDIVKKYKI